MLFMWGFTCCSAKFWIVNKLYPIAEAVAALGTVALVAVPLPAAVFPAQSHLAKHGER
jgi:hypothetical protein